MFFIFPASGLDGNSARRDFLTYALSLMRCHNNEHSDTLPVMDISALKHVAYVLDALIYYMRSGTDPDADGNLRGDGACSVHSWQDHDDTLNDETDPDDGVGNHSVAAMETDSIDGDGGSDVVVSAVGRGVAGRKHPFFQRSDSISLVGCAPPDPFQVRFFVVKWVKRFLKVTQFFILNIYL